MKRLEALRSKFHEYEIDSLLITSSPNRQYMTHFSGTAGVALISETKAIFITDFRYMEQAKEQVKGYEVVQQTGNIIEEVARQAEKLGLRKLGFEETLSFGEYKQYSKSIESAKLIPVSGLIEEIRLIKDDHEIKLIQDAADIADAAFAHIITYIRPGITELDVSNELEFFMRKQGATGSCFDIIVASGHRSALPHGVASDKMIEKGELVTLDFGAYYKGYCSDITRTVAVVQVNDKLKEIYDTVLQAQLLGMNGIKAGMTGKQADALTRDYITEKGYGDYFGHSTGHGLGKEVHEGPTLSVNSNTVLEPGMVVTVEPGIYISGVGGTRIEDDILITADGNKSFTHSTKELLIIGE
ncbi:aminopeptidase P family protein [bacterium LRH843]|nr:aminopeptidase P family protein [bacterium LRH843]